MIPLLVFAACVWLFARQFTADNRRKWGNRQATLVFFGRYLAADARGVRDSLKRKPKLYLVDDMECGFDDN